VQLQLQADSSSRKITSSTFSTCQYKCIFTPSKLHDGSERSRNMNVCAPDSDPRDPKTFFSNSWLSFTLYHHSCSFPPTPVDISYSEKQLKEHHFFLIWYTMYYYHVFTGTKLVNPILSLYKTFVLFWGAYHTVSTVPYPVQVRKLSSHQRNSKKGLFMHNSLSMSFSLSLSLKDLCPLTIPRHTVTLLRLRMLAVLKIS
jgi:hypothetical protein